MTRQDYTTSQDSVNTKPAYYAIIPSGVRYCKNLEPSAKLLYGEITALCNQQGYCWAGNQYFADLYEVDISTIKRWISSLVSNGFIRTEKRNCGFKTERKIFIIPEDQKMIAEAQKRADRQKSPPEPLDAPRGRLKNEPTEGGKNEPQILHPNNTSVVVVTREDEEGKLSEQQQQSPQTRAPNSIEIRNSKGKATQITRDDLYRLGVAKEWTPTEINGAWETLSSYQGRINDWSRYAEGIVTSIRMNDDAAHGGRKPRIKTPNSKPKQDTKPKKKFDPSTWI